MVTSDLLRIILLAQIAAVVLLIAGLFVRSGTQWWFEKRHGSAARAASAALARMLGANEGGAEAGRLLASLPRSMQIRLMWEIAPNLEGGSLTLLRERAAGVGLLDWADRQCASRRWHRRLVGVRLLTLLRVERPTALPLLDDPHPLVRAQAIEWAADHADEATLARMIAHFEDPSTLCLFTTQDSLLRIGRAAVAPLVEYLEGIDTKALEPALVVATGLAEPRLIPAAIVLAEHSDPGVRAGAAALLGAIGGELPVARLMQMIGDPDGGVRAGAARALGELAHWPAAPNVAALLRDLDFRVRREAGLALRAFGAPGHLMLRHYRSDADPYAADMARQVLGLPEPAAPVTA